MKNHKRFLIREFQLEVNDSAYLVNVNIHDGKTEGFEDPQKLPKWVFQSRHAIWLGGNSETLLDRAMEGDRIRTRLKIAVNQL